MKGTAVVAAVREGQTVTFLEMGMYSSPFPSLTHTRDGQAGLVCLLIVVPGRSHGQRFVCVCKVTVRSFYRAVSDPNSR
jgi:hypothetical protein